MEPGCIIDGAVPRTLTERCFRLYEWAQDTGEFSREQLTRMLMLAADSETIERYDPDPWENEDRMIEIIREVLPEHLDVYQYAGDVMIGETNEDGGE